MPKIFIMKKFENIAQAREYVQSLQIGQMIELCSKLLIESQTEKVFLTQEQFETFFKVRGLRVVPETRGRKTLSSSENVTDFGSEEQTLL